MRHECRPPLALGDVGQREPEPVPLDAHDDQAEAGPGVEPAVQSPQLRRAGRELEENQGGAALVSHCNRPTRSPALRERVKEPRGST